MERRKRTEDGDCHEWFRFGVGWEVGEGDWREKDVGNAMWKGGEYGGLSL